MLETVVFLHGFAATHRMWDRVSRLLPGERYLPLALDLPGHGAAAAVRPVSYAACVEAVERVAPPSFVLCGYSLGGRVALHVALALGERVRRLVLVSATAGIADAGERAARRRADEELARRIESQPIDAFIEDWARGPLFADDPPNVRAAVAGDQRRNAPAGLAAALRGIGAGAGDAVWHRLGELRMASEIVVGGRDVRYVELGHELVAGLPRARLRIVAGAGHRLPLEAPQAVALACRGER